MLRGANKGSRLVAAAKQNVLLELDLAQRASAALFAARRPIELALVVQRTPPANGTNKSNPNSSLFSVLFDTLRAKRNLIAFHVFVGTADLQNRIGTNHPPRDQPTNVVHDMESKFLVHLSVRAQVIGTRLVVVQEQINYQSLFPQGNSF